MVESSFHMSMFKYVCVWICVFSQNIVAETQDVVHDQGTPQTPLLSPVPEVFILLFALLCFERCYSYVIRVLHEYMFILLFVTIAIGLCSGECSIPGGDYRSEL